MAIKARIYLVRHGETDANRDKIIQGQLDTPLNEIGLEQAKLVGQALSSITFDVAFSSDLCRAAATAQSILEHQDGLDLYRQEELRERFMGELQGQAIGHIRWTSVDGPIETGPAFIERAMAWWRKDVAEYIASLPLREKPYNILAVSHGGFIGTLVRHLIQNHKLRVEKGVIVVTCPNTSVSIVEWSEQGELVLVQYGDASHLSVGPLGHNADEIKL